MYQGRQRQRQQAELRRSAAHLPWEEVAWFVAHRQGPALYQGGSRGPVCSSRPRARLCTKAGSNSRQSCGARQRTSRREEVAWFVAHRQGPALYQGGATARFVDHGRGPGCVPRLVMAARRGGRASGRRRPSIGVHRVAVATPRLLRCQRGRRHSSRQPSFWSSIRSSPSLCQGGELQAR